MAQAFGSSTEHVLAQLRRVGLLLRAEAQNIRHADAHSDAGPSLGLYISGCEVDRLLNGPSLPDSPANPAHTPLSEELRRLKADIARRTAASLSGGMELRLHRLSDELGLSPFDVDVLLLCLLPEVDLRFQRLFGYVQDDATRKSPSIGLALRLFCTSQADGLASRDRFSQRAPLLRNRILDIDAGCAGDALPGKTFRCDQRIAGYLLGSDQIDCRLQPFAELSAPSVKLDDVVLPGGTKRRLARMAGNRPDRMTFSFHGPRGSGKRTTAEALCALIGQSLLVIDVPPMLAVETPFDTCVALAIREAWLSRSALYWESFDALLSAGRAVELTLLTRQLAGWRGLSFVATEDGFGRPEAWQDTTFIEVGFLQPSFEERQRLWKISLDGRLRAAGGVDVTELSNKFRLTGGQIRSAVADAEDRARWRSSGGLSMDDLRWACQEQSNRRLGSFARKVEAAYTWSDIVLPPEQMSQLQDISRYVKYRHLVYGDWNFEHRLSLGKGLAVLFAGPSGTGKTMAAGIIANELKLDIYKIDLAGVVSKYIGETEKNLSRIFNEAEASNAILFFDEADALFGKRTEVKDSHDRYANIEVGYLLQRIEEYEGMVVLATNLRQNMDDAFVRRMQFIVEFPYPEEEHRYHIWKGIFPTQAPLDKNVDFDFLARQFKIAGGNIKNIALGAAFLAADDGGVINMKHLARAARREFNKMGKLCVETDFGPYYALAAEG